jgi:phosphomannomutase/phosphoglucomutase
MSLSSDGATSAIAEVAGKPVAGSAFSVYAGLPDAFIVLPHVWPLAALLTLLGSGVPFFCCACASVRLHPQRLNPKRWRCPQELKSSVHRSTSRQLPRDPPRTLPSAPAIELDPSIFRAYDVRGVVGKTLNKEVARALGQSIGTLMGEKGCAKSWWAETVVCPVPNWLVHCRMVCVLPAST